MRTPLDIVIFGIGAMGCRFGFALSSLKKTHLDYPTTVTLTGSWRKQIEILNDEGLTVLQSGHRTQKVTLKATSNWQTLSADIALVLVKSWQTAEVASQINRILKPNGFALTLQNGLGNFETLAASLGNDRVAAGRSALGANLAGPGILRLGGNGLTRIITTPMLTKSLTDFSDILNRSGIPTQCTDTGKRIIWEKLIANAVINPLTAIHDVKNGEILKNESFRSLMHQIVEETTAVASAEGIHIDTETAIEHVYNVCKVTANNISSMLQDLRNGRKTEIEAINGAIVSLGCKHGIPTPVNKAMVMSIMELNNNDG